MLLLLPVAGVSDAYRDQKTPNRGTGKGADGGGVSQVTNRLLAPSIFLSHLIVDQIQHFAEVQRLREMPQDARRVPPYSHVY